MTQTAVELSERSIKESLASRGASMLDAALGYAARGWAIFPCEENGKRPHETGSANPATHQPYRIAWGKNATSDPKQIKAWWTRWPQANIGLPAKPNHLLIIDGDSPKNEGDPDGVAAWTMLAADLGLPETVTQDTPNGGLHVIYRIPAGVTIGNRDLEPGINVRGVKGDGGYVVLTPSIHPNGNPYHWSYGLGPDEIEIADLPPALIALLTPPSPEQRARPIVQSRTRIPSMGQSAYGKAALQREADKVSRSLNGTRNNVLNEAAFSLGQLVGGHELEQSEVEQTLLEAAAVAGLDEGEAIATINSGLLAGLQSPRSAPPKVQSKTRIPDTSYIGDMPALTSGVHVEQHVAGKQRIPTDDELAQRWIDANPFTFYGVGEWRRYSDGVWPVIPSDNVRNEIKSILIAAKSEGVRPSQRLLSSVIELARISVSVPDQMWDANEDVLVCGNGALRISTRELMPHSPDFLATERVGFDYDPTATAPTWQYAISSTVPEATDLLQEFAGYSLTTSTRHEIALWLYGQPGSGKSTLIEGIVTMLGGRAGVLGLAAIERSQFALTALPGKTLVTSTEQPATFIKSVHVLNSIISGEPTTVERKYSDPFVVIPRAKILWSMNELPRVGEANSGLFRRVKVIAFPPLPEDMRDPDIKERIKQEGAGILNWALDGLDRLNQRGRFEIPAAVADATADFKNTNDIPSIFIDEMCATGAGYRTQAKVLYDAYKLWCVDNGHKPQSSTSLAEDWKRLGLERYDANGHRWWRGVGLTDQH